GRAAAALAAHRRRLSFRVRCAVVVAAPVRLPVSVSFRRSLCLRLSCLPTFLVSLSLILTVAPALTVAAPRPASFFFRATLAPIEQLGPAPGHVAVAPGVNNGPF